MLCSQDDASGSDGNGGSGGGGGAGASAGGGGIDAAEARLIEIRERYALRRAVLSLQGDRAARSRRLGGERGLGNASARLLLR